MLGRGEMLLLGGVVAVDGVAEFFGGAAYAFDCHIGRGCCANEFNCCNDECRDHVCKI